MGDRKPHKVEAWCETCEKVVMIDPKRDGRLCPNCVRRFLDRVAPEETAEILGVK